MEEAARLEFRMEEMGEHMPGDEVLAPSDASGSAVAGLPENPAFLTPWGALPQEQAQNLKWKMMKTALSQTLPGRRW